MMWYTDLCSNSSRWTIGSKFYNWACNGVSRYLLISKIFVENCSSYYKSRFSYNSRTRFAAVHTLISTLIHTWTTLYHACVWQYRLVTSCMTMDNTNMALVVTTAWNVSKPRLGYSKQLTTVKPFISLLTM